MKPPEIDSSELPLCEGPPTDDVTNDEEKRDDVAVLASENGLAGSRSMNGTSEILDCHKLNEPTPAVHKLFKVRP